MIASDAMAGRFDVPMRDLRLRVSRRPYRPRPAGLSWPVRMAGRASVRALLAIVIAGCMVSTFALG